MARRLLTYALLAVVALGGVLPLAGAYRCPTMGRRAADSCCHPAGGEGAGGDELAGDEARQRLTARCCDTIDAPLLDARAVSSRDPAPQRSPLCLCAVPPSLPAGLDLPRAREPFDDPGDRPPGDLLHRLSSVLRV